MDLEIIAELAQGYEGNASIAKLLVKSAALAGADSAKFQLVIAEELATVEYEHYSLFKKLEMPVESWNEVKQTADEHGISLQFDIFGEISLHLAEIIGVKTIKIHPTDIGNRLLIRMINSSNIGNVVIGIGGAKLSEIKVVVDELISKSIVLLCGFQAYPTANEDNQLSRLEYIRKNLGDRHPRISFGFADHADPESDLSGVLGGLAIGYGASVLEKHMTLDRLLQLEDYESALNPVEFAHYVVQMRSAVAAAGTCQSLDGFGMSSSEMKYRDTVRRQVVAQIDIDAGTEICESMICLKRSEGLNGLVNLDEVVGKTVIRGVPKGTAFTDSMLR
jgi:N,N'-diacetyllegionaminate synthase